MSHVNHKLKVTWQDGQENRGPAPPFKHIPLNLAPEGSRPSRKATNGKGKSSQPLDPMTLDQNEGVPDGKGKETRPLNVCALNHKGKRHRERERHGAEGKTPTGTDQGQAHETKRNKRTRNETKRNEAKTNSFFSEAPLAKVFKKVS